MTSIFGYRASGRARCHGCAHKIIKTEIDVAIYMNHHQMHWHHQCLRDKIEELVDAALQV